MYHRDWLPWDPLVRVRDYGEHANQLVYSEDSTKFDNEIVKTAEGGMDVFIRKK